MILLAFLLVQSVNLGDPDLIARGERIFAQSCSVGYCHGIGGTAGRGPRLRGRQLDEDYVYRVTREGIPQSAMPGWEGRLADTDIHAVVAYVMSLASATEAPPDPTEMPPGVGPADLTAFSGPPEVKPGYDLFFDSTRMRRCSTCHFLDGRGIPIGPDLSNLRTQANSDLLSLIRNRRSTHVVTVTLTNGEAFPSLPAGQDGNRVKFYDLSSPLPVLRTLERSTLVSVVLTEDWEHASVAETYSESELKAIVSYLRWMISRDR